jgi:hypothetical protein
LARQVFETDEEWDDGGTPAYRQRQADKARYDEARRRELAKSPRRKAWDRMTIPQVMIIGYLAPFVILALIAIPCIAYAIIGDWLHGYPI